MGTPKQMGYTVVSASEKQADRFDRYKEDNNVKDIKSDLSVLKKQIQGKETPVTKDEKVEYFGNAETKQTREQFAEKLDTHIELSFDTYIQTNASHIKDLIRKGDAGILELQKEFNAFIWDPAIADADTDFNVLKTNNIILPLTFELNALKEDIKQELGLKGKNGLHNAFENLPGEGGSDISSQKEAQEKFNNTPDYIDAYPPNTYNLATKGYKIEKIYKDNGLLRVMERIFDNEQQKELRKGTFNINLDKEDGLAGIIIDVREAAEYLATYGDLSEGEANYDANKKAIIDIFGLEVDEESGAITIGSDQQTLRTGIKELVRQGILTYKGALGDYISLAKIFDRAQWQDLDTFASLVQSKDDITMAVKEWNNALNITGQNREWKEKGKEKLSLINETNIFEFLCDFDSNGKLGDMATVFGDQVLFTINQAIGVVNVENPGTGEQTVIFNVLKNMDISDRRLTDSKLFKDMLGNPSECTKKNLAKLFNGYEDSEGTKIPGMPELKIFFLDTIKKINGGSETTTPDLYDTLVGNDDEQMLSLYYQESTEIRDDIHERLLKIDSMDDEEYKELKATIAEQGIVYVEDTFFTNVMKVLNNVSLVLSNGSITNLQAMGIGKSWEVDTVRNELLTEIKKSITTGLHYSSAGGLRLTIGTGKSGVTESGRTKWSRGAEAGVMVGQKMDLYIGTGGEVLEQYNYKSVINANLSDVQKATYLGLEGGAGIGIRRGIELYGGVSREQNAEMGINQLDEQYRFVSDKIFDISRIDTDDLSDKQKFESYMHSRITGYPENDPHKQFVESNIQHLTDNLGFIIRYMDAHEFFGPEGKIAQLPQSTRKAAIISLVNILQSGNIEQRRHDVIMGLHGKIEITKLSFGLTTSALTRQTGKRKFGGSNTTGGGTDEEGGLEGGGGESEVDLAEDRFGIAGYYMGIRVSTWVNHYVPQTKQYLFTEYEMGQGIGVQKVEVNNTYEKDLKKYADYIEAFYNDGRLQCFVENNTIKIVFTKGKTDGDLTLEKFLNLRTTDEAEKNFSLKGNELIIGNVGPIGTYTVTEAKGVRRVLCLGTEKIDEAHKFQNKESHATIAPIEQQTLSYKERNKNAIDTKIIDQMSGTGLDAEVVKSETKQFFDAQGKLTKPADKNVEYQNCAVGQLLKNGSVTITKKTTGIYEVTYISTPADKLTISYIDQQAYETQYNAAINNPANRVEHKIDLPQNAFTLPQTITSVFTKSIEQGLSVFDDYEKTLYRDFMESIVDTNLDNFIDENDYTTAFNVLKTILESNAKYANYPALKSLIEGDLSLYEKALIVDKFKTIFSYILVLTDGKIDGHDVATTANGRGEYYRTIKGPDDITNYPLPQSYKTKAVNAIKNESSLSRETVENLVGFTAFYRLDGKAKKYAMTPIGGTNILQGSNANSMVTIEQKDLPATQEWFISNLTVNTTNTNILLNKINSSIASAGITITEKQLPDLLRGTAITLDSGKKISIDIDYVFYLLGECANESLGAKIKGIKISEFKEPVDDQENNTLPGKYTATGVSEKIYEYGASVYSKSHSVASEVQAEEKKFGAKYHQHTDIYDPKGKTNTDAKGGGTSDPGTYFDNETYDGNE